MWLTISIVYIFKCYTLSYFLNRGLGSPSTCWKSYWEFWIKSKCFWPLVLVVLWNDRFGLIPFLCSWMTLNKFLNLLVSSFLYKSITYVLPQPPSRKGLSEIIYVKCLTLFCPIPWSFHTTAMPVVQPFFISTQNWSRCLRATFLFLFGARDWIQNFGMLGRCCTAELHPNP